MKKVFLTVAFIFATVFSFGSNQVTLTFKDCWTEILVLSCGGEVSIYECGDGTAHYEAMVFAEKFFCDLSDGHINNL